MKLRGRKNVCFLFVLGMSLISCVNKDLGNISETLYFTPGYSLPVGSEKIVMEDIYNDYINDFIPAPDSIVVKGDSAVIYYENNYYIVPSTFEFNATSDLDLSSVANKIDYITSLTFRTNYENYIPGKVRFQIFLLDANEFIIDSLFTKRMEIEPPEINDKGEVIEPKIIQKQDIYFSKEDITRLMDIAFVKSVATLDISSFFNTNVKYYSDQPFLSQVGIRVELDIPLHEL